MTNEAARKQKFSRIIIGYPFALLAIALLFNLFVFGVDPAVISLPTMPVFASLSLSAVVLVVIHSWLMTTTELTRVKFNMHATPEEWDASAHERSDVSAAGRQELERQHNAHNNATENSVYFAVLALLVSLVSPVAIAAQVWFAGFALGRLGHAFFYLTGKSGGRGLAMSVSLISLYGLVSYLVLSLII